MRHLLPLPFLISISISICGAAPHEHREHGAHVHGAGKLDVAFDDAKGKIEFLGAAEGILGFEYKAKSAKDKKTLANALTHFENDIGTLVQFDPALGCKFTKELLGQVPEKGEEGSGEHSDWAGNFSVVCAKSPLGTKVTIDFSSFPKLADVDVTILAGAVQKSAEFKKKPVTLELK